MASLPGVKTTIQDRFFNSGRVDLPGGPLIAVIAKRGNVHVEGENAPDFAPFYAASGRHVAENFGIDSYALRAFTEAISFGAPRVVLIPLPEDTVFDHNTATVTSPTPAYAGLDLFDIAFAEVESTRASIIVPWGAGGHLDGATPSANEDYFYADNSPLLSTSWVAKIAQKCYDITNESFPCFAVMGVKSISGVTRPSATEVESWIDFEDLIPQKEVTVADGSPAGHFVSVVASECTPIGYELSWGWTNGAAAYAATAARIDSWKATTGKPVLGINASNASGGARIHFSRAQAERLTEKGLITIGRDYSRIPKWVDGLTFADKNSDFVRLTTLRIAFDVVKNVISVSESFRGEAMSLQAQNAFETQISSRLRAMTQVGALNSSDFRVTYVPSESKAMIDVAITPAFELREIILRLSVNF